MPIFLIPSLLIVIIPFISIVFFTKPHLLTPKRKTPYSRKKIFFGLVGTEIVLIIIFIVGLISYSKSPENQVNLVDKQTHEAQIENITSLEKKYPLTLRQQIFQEVVAVEDRARDEAEVRFPTIVTHPDYQEGNIEKMLSLMDELQEKYRNEVFTKHNLTKEEFRQISEEAFENDWALD